MKTLLLALRERKPTLGCIHHSDQGLQYAAHESVDLCQQYRFRIFLKSNPLDNATVKCVFKTFKSEEAYLWEYTNLVDVETRVSRFSEEVCNQKWFH